MINNGILIDVIRRELKSANYEISKLEGMNSLSDTVEAVVAALCKHMISRTNRVG